MKRIILTLISMVVFFSCSSNESDQIQPIDQVVNDNIIYSMEDFFYAGFKKSKDYDVSELPGAISVTYGFWKTPNKVPIDYEIRIYPSHNEAVNIGSKYAKERSGDTALLDENESSWKEGLKESRFCSGPTRSGGGVNCRLPKYNNFYIYSNSIILCQGRNVEESSINCEFLINTLK